MKHAAGPRKNISKKAQTVIIEVPIEKIKNE